MKCASLFGILFQVLKVFLSKIVRYSYRFLGLFDKTIAFIIQSSEI